MNCFFKLVLVVFAGVCAGKTVEGPRHAFVDLNTLSVSGKIILEQASNSSPVKLRGVIFGLSTGVHSVHVHAGNELGERCEKVGEYFSPVESRKGERPASYLGNIKTFSGDPSRTEINLISVSVSLYDSSPVNIARRSLVVHVRPDDLSSNNKWDSFEESDILACGLIDGIDFENAEALLQFENHTKISEQSSTVGKDVRIPLSHISSATTTSPANSVWKVGFSYEYDYSGYMASSIAAISSKMSGGSIKGRVIVEPYDENIVNVAFREAKAKQFNEDVVGKLHEVDPGQETAILDQEYLEKPFQLKFSAGKVENLYIGEEEPLWIVNFKRGLATQLQLQLDDSSGVFTKPELKGYYAENTYYHTTEGSVNGVCKVDYHISHVPEDHFEPDMIPATEFCLGYPVYEILKTRDFDECQILPVFNQLNVPGVKCDIAAGTGCGNAMSHIDIVRIIGCTAGDGQFIVQRIKATDKIVNKPLGYETEAVEGQAIQFFSLTSIHQNSDHMLTSPLSSNFRVYNTLVYFYDSDQNTSGSMAQPSLNEVKYPSAIIPDKRTLYTEGIRLFKAIVSDLESDDYYYDPIDKYVPEKIANLRRVFTHFDYSELKEFFGKYYVGANESNTARQILIDTLVFCGTSPAFNLLRELILKQQVTGERALQAISHLPGTLETPTVELLESFFGLITSETVTANRQLKITTALSLTRLVYQACINSTISINRFPKIVMGSFCNSTDAVIIERLVPWLADEIKNASDAAERIALLTALGNIGHEIIVSPIKPYIMTCEKNKAVMVNISNKEIGKKDSENVKRIMNTQYKEDVGDQALCNIVRAKAIFSLSHLALAKKEIIYTLLAPIAFNKAEKIEVRLAAWSLLFVSNPPQSFWNRAALSTWYEPNAQVAHFIYTTIASKAVNKDPTKRDEVNRAEAALPMMKPMYWTSYVALNYHMAGYVEKVRLGYAAEFINFPGHESFVPSHHYSAISLLLGPLAAKLGEVSFFSQYAEKFLDSLLGKPGLRFKFNKDDASITSPELENIKSELKIEARATGQPELFIYVNILDNYQRFYEINYSNIMQTLNNELIQSIRKSNNEPMKFNIHKFTPLINGFYRIPSSMGFAYSIVGQSSLLVSFKASTQFDLSRFPIDAKLECVLQPVVQIYSVTKVLGELPFTRTYPIAGVQGNVAFAMPGRFLADLNLGTGGVHISWEFMGDRRLHVGHMAITPYTTLRRIGDFSPCHSIPETKISTSFEKPRKEERVFGENFLGLRFIYEAEGDKYAFKTPKAYNEELLGFFTFSTFPVTVRHYSQSWYLDLARSETKTVNFFFNLAFKSNAKIEDSPAIEPYSISLIEAVSRKLFGSDDLQRQQRMQTKRWFTKKFQRFLALMSDSSGYSLDFALEFTPKSSSTASRRMGSSITYTQDGLRQRGNIMLESRSQADTKFVICADFDAAVPQTFTFKHKDSIKESERASKFTIGFGKSCTEDRKITVSTKFAHREDDFSQFELVGAHRETCQKEGVSGQFHTEECVLYHQLYSIFNKVTVEIVHNDMPIFLTNATYRVANMFRYWLGAYMTENRLDVDNAQGKIIIEALYDPINSFADIEVYKPNSNIFFRGLKVHPSAVVMLPQRMISPRPFMAGPGVCTVGTKYVYTFDGLLYNATFGTCDQVLAMDCSGRHKFAVLGHEEDEKKIVTILLNGEKIIINPALSNANINGVNYPVTEQPYDITNAENETYGVIKMTTDNFVEFNSPDSHMIRVLSNHEEIVIMSSPLHRGRMCGLCGSLTGDKLTDLTGPRRCPIPRDYMDVAYELKTPTGCKSRISAGKFFELHLIQKECKKNV